MPLFDLLANATRVRSPGAASASSANANASRAEPRSGLNNANRAHADRLKSNE